MNLLSPYRNTDDGMENVMRIWIIKATRILVAFVALVYKTFMETQILYRIVLENIKIQFPTMAEFANFS